MSWVKRNLYFVISCVVAVALLVAAGWYCYSSWQRNDANWQELSQDYSQLSQLLSKNPGAGNETVTNIDTAREQARAVQQRVAELEKLFTPIHGIPNTNHFDDHMMASAVRQTVGELRAAAAAHSVTLPAEFDFSFTLQEGKIVYDPNSWDQLSKQLGEVTAICDIVFSSRVTELDGVQRERTADDVNPNGATVAAPDYIDSTSVTNQNNVVITPYQLTFQCFTPELGSLLSSFANQPHTYIVKTLNVQPQEFMPGMEPGGMQPPIVNARGAATVIDEKKLKVVLQVDVVKRLPAPGR
jgi:hypothetical protein